MSIKDQNLNSKSEYLPDKVGIPMNRENSKQILISQFSKFQTCKFGTLGFRIWDLFRISPACRPPAGRAGTGRDFVLRIFKLCIVILIFTFCILNYSCYAAPCYGTKMPLKKQFFLGAQTHMLFKRYLKDEQGKLRSTQYFLLVSYGVYDWLSIDLKAGSGNIKQHPVGSDEIDYSSRFAGGYGFRLRLYQKDNLKAVFGFQHISVHPRKTHLGNVEHQAVLDDWQFSLLASYAFKKITPYLGTRWSRMDYIHWTDESRKRIKSDLTKDIGLIVGLDLPLVKNFWINLEGNFLDSEAVAFSLNYSF